MEMRRNLNFFYLNSCLGEFGALGEFLPRVNVRVLSAVKRPFQFVHLLGSERCPVAALFAF